MRRVERRAWQVFRLSVCAGTECLVPRTSYGLGRGFFFGTLPLIRPGFAATRELLSDALLHPSLRLASHRSREPNQGPRAATGGAMPISKGPPWSQLPHHLARATRQAAVTTASERDASGWQRARCEGAAANHRC